MIVLSAGHLAPAARADPPDRRYIQALADLLESDEEDERMQAALELDKLGAQAWPASAALVSALGDVSPRVRLLSQGALASIGQPAVKHLAKALSSKNKYIRRHSSLLLCFPAFDVAGVRSSLFRALKDPDSEVRANVAIALARLGEQGVQPLLRALKSDDPGARAVAAAALASITALSEPALVRMMASRDRQHRAASAMALGLIENPSDRVVQALLAAMGDEQPSVRAAGARAVRHCRSRVGDVAPVLVRGLSDDEESVRLASAQALGGLGAGALPFYEGELKAQDKQVLAALEETFRRLGKAGVPTLIQALEGPDPDAAARMLGRVGAWAQDAIPALEQAGSETALEAVAAIRRSQFLAKDCSEGETALENGDEESGLAILEDAAYAGNLRALFVLGRRRLATNQEGGLVLCKLSAEGGHADAQVFLGDCHRLGTFGLPREKIAIGWYRKAAEQGAPEGQYRLGEMLRNPLLEKDRDDEQAVQWLGKAARQGHVEAMVSLARMWDRGWRRSGGGSRSSWGTALEWMLKAAKRGHPMAQHWLSQHYARPPIGEPDFVEAYAWAILALDGGSKLDALRNSLKKRLKSSERKAARERATELREEIAAAK